MNPHERISHVGGYEGSQWKLTLNDAIGKIESGESAFVVQAARRRVNVIVAVSPSRQKYLNTEIDGDQPDTLLRLPECPLAFDVTPGEAHETQSFGALMALHNTYPGKLLGDRGYDSTEIRDHLTKQGIEPVIPPRSNRKTPIEY